MIQVKTVDRFVHSSAPQLSFQVAPGPSQSQPTTNTAHKMKMTRSSSYSRFLGEEDGNGGGKHTMLIWMYAHYFHKLDSCQHRPGAGKDASSNRRHQASQALTESLHKLLANPIIPTSFQNRRHSPNMPRAVPLRHRCRTPQVTRAKSLRHLLRYFPTSSSYLQG
jgi:hypothetical protein